MEFRLILNDEVEAKSYFSAGDFETGIEQIRISY